MGGRVNDKRARQGGLSLIELLVVLVIIAMTASVIILNAPPPVGEARKEADRFAARINMAAERAIMTNTLIGLELTPGGFAFYEYDRGVWRDSKEARLTKSDFPPDMSVEFEIVDSAQKNEEDDDVRNLSPELPAPNVYFYPTGETTPLEVTFMTRRAEYEITLDNVGDLQIEELRNGR